MGYARWYCLSSLRLSTRKIPFYILFSEFHIGYIFTAFIHQVTDTSEQGSKIAPNETAVNIF
jgi:hypothetical protein